MISPGTPPQPKFSSLDGRQALDGESLLDNGHSLAPKISLPTPYAQLFQLYAYIYSRCLISVCQLYTESMP